jgi:hypothetical protein
MPSPEELALQRAQAIEQLIAGLDTAVTAAQRRLYEELLARLSDTYDDPMVIPQLLAEYTQAVAVPLASYYAAQVLALPALNVSYFQALEVRGYQQLRAPLTSFLEKKFGVTAAGQIIPGGVASTYANQGALFPAQRELLTFAYQAQVSGAGLTAYKAGLEQLVTGGNTATGLMQKLYEGAADTFSQADRSLQVLAAERLSLSAYLYQGGLISGSRPFCVKRNGKVWTDAEIKMWGTAKDKTGGYTDKKAGKFSGKSEPYDPMVDCGGYSCRHTLHALPNVIALRFRPDLMENDAGELVAKA